MGYPGGKGGCFRSIIGLMAPHRTYIETHLGGGAVMRNKRPAERNIGVEIDARIVASWRARVVPYCEVVQTDAVTFLRSFQFVGGEMVYADPPYLPETRKRSRVYRYDYEVEDHVELLKTLAALPCSVILSGYDSRLYDEALPGWRKIRFGAGTQAGLVTEVAWMNFPEPTSLHDLRFLGADFRDRESIRRRRDGLLSRIGGLEAKERHALLECLARVHARDLTMALERAK